MLSLPSFIKSQEGVPPNLRPGRKIIIDTDAGSDDAHAIITAVHLAKKLGAEIIGITCVSGNTLLPLVLKNVKIALHLAGEPDIPIFAGCDRALNQNQWMDNFFLEDGICGQQKRYMEYFKIDENNIAQKKHAVNFLIDSIKKYQDELRIIMIGPFTNLATALIKDHAIQYMISQVVCLGGNFLGLGLVENGVAEFNSYTDVEAFHLVFKVLQDKLIMVPYESVVVVDPVEDREHFSKTFEHHITHKGKFVKDIHISMFKCSQQYHVQDPLSVIIAMMPEVVSSYIQKKCQVVLHGEGRGLIAVDWFGRMKTKNNIQGQVTIITGTHKQQILEILHEVVRDDHPDVVQLMAGLMIQD